MTSTITEATTTPEELRDRAAAHDAEAERSFRDCDTDGFRSQHAHGVMAQFHRLNAEILERGGVARFPALFDLDGNLVAAKLVDGRFGESWCILDSDDPNSRAIGWFKHSRARTPGRARKTDADKGWYVGYVMAPAKAKLVGGATVYAMAVRTDGGFSGGVTIVDDGQGKFAALAKNEGETGGNGGTWYSY